MPPHLPLILYHKGRNNFSSADEEEKLFIEMLSPGSSDQCVQTPHIQHKQVSGPQESQKPPQTIFRGKGKGTDEGDQR